MFSLATNSINIVVFLISKFREEINKYMFINSTCDFVFLLTRVFVCVYFVVVYNGLYGYSYGAKIFQVYIYWYSGYVVIIFGYFLGISITIDRYFSFKISSRYNKFKLSLKVRCIVIILISGLVCIPNYPLSRQPKAFGKLAIFD